MPRMRGRLYSSCASSTCSLPSALVACWAKMSRISCVRSTTRAVRAFSSAFCCAGSSSSSTISTSAWASSYTCFSSSSFPLPTYVRGSGFARCCTSSAIGSTPAVRASSRSSPSSSSESAERGSTARTSPRSGSTPELGFWRVVTWRIVPRLQPMSDLATRLAERTLELVEHSLGEQARGGDRRSRPLARAGLLRAGVRGRGCVRLGPSAARGRAARRARRPLRHRSRPGERPRPDRERRRRRTGRERHERRPRGDARAGAGARGARASRPTSTSPCSRSARRSCPPSSARFRICSTTRASSTTRSSRSCSSRPTRRSRPAASGT